MGCDIHVYAEKKINNKWICINPLVYDNYKWVDNKRHIENLYDGRNYELFSFLAQVRGIDKEGFKPKGFPKEASSEVQYLYKRWGEDAHTPSFLTLKELNEKLKGTINVSGMMRKDRLSLLKQSITKHLVDENSYINWELLYPYCEYTTKKCYTHFTLAIPRKVHFKYFTQTVIDFLSHHSMNIEKQNDYCDSKVRIVFWFDN